MSIGSYILIKNEKQWIGPHIMAWLPYLDELVFYDGNSTDGTIEDIVSVMKYHPLGGKIRLFWNKDPQDLAGDYTRLFNDCLHELNTDFAFFLHPDMFPISGQENLQNLKPNHAFFTHMKSYAGDNMDDVSLIVSGRMEPWKNIMRLNNPDLGLHYHGAYGAADEDMYFSAITGSEYKTYKQHMDLYPYGVYDSGVHIAHFSDVRPYERRLGRMVSCLKNQGYPEDILIDLAKTHSRVTLQDNAEFKFCKRGKIMEFEKPKKEFENFTSFIKVGA